MVDESGRLLVLEAHGWTYWLHDFRYDEQLDTLKYSYNP